MVEYSSHRQQTNDLFRGEWGESLFSVIDLFPIPMGVFSPDGISLFVNKAFSDFFHIDPEKIVGHLNVLHDPYLNHRLGLTDYLQRVFSGEILSYNDVRVPFEEIENRYAPIQIQRGLAEDSMYQDITCFPLLDQNDSVNFIIALFMTKHVYQSRSSAMKAKEYLDAHWIDDFDLDRIAKVAGVSRYHLAHLFKKNIGMTPYGYYQKVKIEKIQEALCNELLSISEAFASCGADYSGGFADAFKRRVGMTPTQYRKTLTLHSCESKQKISDTPFSHSLGEMESRLFQILELFPIPIQIFEPGGDIVFINEAVLKVWNVGETTLILGKYNLLRDPLVNDQYGLRDQIRRTFQGEIVIIQDIKIPLESFWEWYKTRSTVYDVEALYTDILNFPVCDADGRMAYVISIFFTSRVYNGRADVAKVREYLENHWREEFNIGKLAEVACLSTSHLARLFKKYTGMTLYGYYQEVKITRLKAALRDSNLSIAEAFTSCGFEYPGNCVRFFKEKTGMTPSQYRKTVVQ